MGQRLEQGAITVREALRVAIEVASGLAHAHRSGVAHRELTPFNVLLCDDGGVKFDFGIGSVARGSCDIVSGAAAYMAPEQWHGVPGDKRSDVFALGVILFEMLSGELPFPDDGGSAVQGAQPAPALRLTSGAVPGALEPLLEAIRADVSLTPDGGKIEEILEALGNLVARMLEKDPFKRPRGAAKLLPSLVAFQRDLAASPSSVTVAVIASSGNAPRSWRHSRRWLSAAKVRPARSASTSRDAPTALGAGTANVPSTPCQAS